jgi:hypothetical protein
MQDCDRPPMRERNSNPLSFNCVPELDNDSPLREFVGAIRDHVMIAAVRAGDSVAGPGMLRFILLPWIIADILRRLPEFPQFRRLRSTLPPDFWEGSRPLSHYLRMIDHWQRSLAFCLLANRFARSRPNFVQVRGTPPEQLKEWGKRPVMVVCLHTGGYVFLRHWLRSRGIVAASLVKSRPEIIRRYEDSLQRKRSEEKNPPYFFHVSDLRAAARFLAPGRVLVLAVEAQPGAHSTIVNAGAPFRLNDGAVRLARKSNAVLLPASVWLHRRLDVCFGNPVPQALIDRPDTQGAMEFLAHEFWDDLAGDPCAIGWTTLEAYAPEHLWRPRTTWP